MRLYSWNMLHSNREQDRAFSFIRDAAFDIFCLQEVREDFLERLKTLPYRIAHGVEMDRLDGKSIERNYCVILTPHPILESVDFPLPTYRYALRTKLFVYLMHPLGWTFSTNRRSVYADVELPAVGRTRVFSLHLTLADPARRMHEFDTAMALRNASTPTIACGDFNILEKPHVTILNWILGGRLRDIFAWHRDRRDFETRFRQLGFSNPLRGTRTQTISRSQLDHILIPNSWRVQRTVVLQDRAGSDHNPVYVQTD